MNISSLGSMSSAVASASTGDAVGILVLKKTLDMQAQSALQLLQALPQPGSNPPNLGQNIDVKA
ncbi:MAG: YjfB family protein [Betaproteobacteria bacterium]